MKPAAFAYARPDTVEDALTLLAGDGAVALAGGQSLIPLLIDRSFTPSLVVDLGRIAALRGIERKPRGLHIGASMRLAAIAASPLVADLPLLAEAIASVATPAIRNRGTLVGNLVRASPNSELPVAVVALDAQLVLGRLGSERELAARDFFLGPHRVAAARGEMVIAVLLPSGDAPQTGSAFVEVAARAGAPPLACVAARLEADSSGLITQARLVAGGITGVPERCEAVEAALIGVRAVEAPDKVAESAVSLPPSPVLPDAAYAADVLPVLLRRAVAIAASRLSALPRGNSHSEALA